MSDLQVCLVVGDAANAEAPMECPVCRWPTLFEFPVWALLPTGVAPAGRSYGCSRCHTRARNASPGPPPPV